MSQSSLKGIAPAAVLLVALSPLQRGHAQTPTDNTKVNTPVRLAR